jgi:hypothetical protein
MQKSPKSKPRRLSSRFFQDDARQSREKAEHEKPGGDPVKAIHKAINEVSQLAEIIERSARDLAESFRRRPSLDTDP